MNVGPLWIRISYHPGTGRLQSTANMNAILEVALLELVKAEIVSKAQRSEPTIGATIAQHPGVLARRVDRDS